MSCKNSDIGDLGTACLCMFVCTPVSSARLDGMMLLISLGTRGSEDSADLGDILSES
jgi:hypothetical protein